MHRRMGWWCMRRSARFSIWKVAKGGAMKADFAGGVAVADRAAVAEAENFAVAAAAAADSILKGIPAVLRRPPPRPPRRAPLPPISAPRWRAVERPGLNRVPRSAEAGGVRREAPAAAVAGLAQAGGRAPARRAPAPHLFLIHPCGPVRASAQRTPLRRVRPVARVGRAQSHRVRHPPAMRRCWHQSRRK